MWFLPTDEIPRRESVWTDLTDVILGWGRINPCPNQDCKERNQVCLERNFYIFLQDGYANSPSLILWEKEYKNALNHLLVQGRQRYLFRYPPPEEVSLFVLKTPLWRGTLPRCIFQVILRIIPDFFHTLSEGLAGIAKTTL